MYIKRLEKGYKKRKGSIIIEKYAAFEAEVSVYTTKIFHRSCSVCDGACCRPEICEESLTSPFLKRLRQRFVPDAAYCDDRGWLKPTGCALPVGRPPVCYQYFCDAVFEKRPTAEFRYAVTILCNLINHIGKKALGSKHIVELQDPAELKRINFTRLEKQFNEAAGAFHLVRAYLIGNIAELKPSPNLNKIGAPPQSN
jgi:hypothetical protein